MTQRLHIPFTRGMMLCGYKSAEYKKHWGYPHYGIDISSRQGNAGDDDNVYACGVGTVLAAGRDNTLGYGAAVLYRGCVGRDGQCRDLVARCMHMRTLAVRTGDTVGRDTVLGREGCEGTADYHLHLELDTDTAYPVHSPQVSQGHTFWHKGTDTTVNPSLWLWQSAARTLVKPTYNPDWLNGEDFTIPTDTREDELRQRLLALAEEIKTQLEA